MIEITHEGNVVNLQGKTSFTPQQIWDAIKHPDGVEEEIDQIEYTIFLSWLPLIHTIKINCNADSAWLVVSFIDTRSDRDLIIHDPYLNRSIQQLHENFVSKRN